jgi:hypothetical protein
MRNFYFINYDLKMLTLFYKGEAFIFDLTKGDVGDYWHGFTAKDGTHLDINYHQEDGDMRPNLEIWDDVQIEEDEDGCGYCYQQIDYIEEYDTIGNAEMYFGKPSFVAQWLNTPIK